MSVTLETIYDVLRTIDDPEMPISIVDLGIVADVRLSSCTEQVGSGSTRSMPQNTGCKPVPHASVDIDILPTFIGCPALPMIEGQIRQRVGAVAGVDEVRVHFMFDPPWSVDRISERGRESLKVMGVTVPERHRGAELVQLSTPLRCPFCESTRTELTSRFGPTRCRMIYHCEACGNTFEHMKRL